jgi:hypothetical protein
MNIIQAHSFPFRTRPEATPNISYKELVNSPIDSLPFFTSFPVRAPPLRLFS